MAPESLFDCLAAAMQQPEVFNLLQVAATACLQETGAVTKRCVGLTIRNTADRMPLTNPSPLPVMPAAPPRTQAPQPVNPCDPFILARRVQSAAPAGTDPAVLFEAVKNMQELMGCRPPQPSPQTTTCIPLGGGAFTCTTR
jgi:hypothetical protein